MWIVYIYRSMFVIWICMMIIPLISSRFMLLEVQDAKNINGNFDFFVGFEMKGQCHKIYKRLLIERKRSTFSPLFALRFCFLCLLAFQKLDSQSHFQLHCWTTSVRADFSLNWDFSRICSVYYRPQNKMTGLGLKILLAFAALNIHYCIFTQQTRLL